MEKKYTLGREDRLKSQKIIEELFLRGKVLHEGCVSLRYWCVVSQGEECNMQFGVGVAKRYLPLAVRRNRIKRQIRECYRLRKPALKEELSHLNQSTYLFLSYRASAMLPFGQIQSDVDKVLTRFSKKQQCGG